MSGTPEWLHSVATLSESSPDAVIVKDADGRVLAWNKAAETLYGFPAAEVIGKPISIIAPSGGWGEIVALIESAQRGNVIIDHRTTRRRKDGSEVNISLSIVPIQDADGKTLGICTTARELPDPRQHARFQEIRWMAAIVESSDDAIIGKTPDGEIISWNRGAERLYQWRAHEALGRHISMLAPDDRADEIPGLMARIIGGESIDHFVTERITKTGERVSVSLTLSPINDSAGHLVGISTIARQAPAA